MRQLSNASLIARGLGDRWLQKGTQKGKIFSNTVSAWVRYREFLCIIEKRYCDASQRFESGMNRLLSLPEGTRQFSEADQREFETLLHEEVEAHLQIESAYLFSKILLDRIADSISYYFGQDWTNRRSGARHHTLHENFSKFCAKAKLTGNIAGLTSMIEDLNSILVTYRNQLIEHPKEPRLTRVTKGGGGVRIAPTMIELAASEANPFLDKDTLTIDELLPKIDAYIQAVVTFLDTNAGASALTS